MNLVTGTIFNGTFPVFTGSHRNARFSHEVSVKGVIVKDSYGAATGQHTFQFEILESSHPSDFAVGTVYRKMGRNMYPNVTRCERPADYIEQAERKALRAEFSSAKARREGRII